MAGQRPAHRSRPHLHRAVVRDQACGLGLPVAVADAQPVHLPIALQDIGAEMQQSRKKAPKKPSQPSALKKTVDAVLK